MRSWVFFWLSTVVDVEFVGTPHIFMFTTIYIIVFKFRATCWPSDLAYFFRIQLWSPSLNLPFFYFSHFCLFLLASSFVVTIYWTQLELHLWFLLVVRIPRVGAMLKAPYAQLHLCIWPDEHKFLHLRTYNYNTKSADT